MILRIFSLLCLFLCCAADRSTDASLNVTRVGDASFRCATVPYNCTTSIQLTKPQVGSLGAVWKKSPVNLAAGFETSFRIQFSEPSLSCPNQHGAYGECLTRGGHGMAFVIQNATNTPLSVIGSGGRGLGYAGIPNSIALELDSWYDPEFSDAYDNHIGVQSMGPGLPNSADHQYCLGLTPDIADLLDGSSHLVKLVYAPTLSATVLHPDKCQLDNTCDKLQSTAQFTHLLSDGVFDSGLGSLTVFFDNLAVPRFIAPLTIGSLVPGPLVYIGFTAACGDAQYQVHEVWDWVLCDASGSCSPVFDFD